MVLLLHSLAIIYISVRTMNDELYFIFLLLFFSVFYFLLLLFLLGLGVMNLNP